MKMAVLFLLSSVLVPLADAITFSPENAAGGAGVGLGTVLVWSIVRLVGKIDRFMDAESKRRDDEAAHRIAHARHWEKEEEFFRSTFPGVIYGDVTPPPRRP